MKKIGVLVFAYLLLTPLFSQTLFTYGADAVSRDEFLRAYNKNKVSVADKAQALKEYLELYYRFKLKVKAAREQGLDTLPQMKVDLQNFRSQVAEGYMNDKKELNKLLEEAIQRSLKDLHVFHFYIDIDSGMSAADTLKAYRVMNELADEINKRKTGFSETTDLISKKYPEVKAKDLGYITVFSLPYPIENLVYNLRPGELSKPYRTKSALHLFGNAGERPDAGKWKIAQILLSIPPNASPEEVKAIETKADSIYNLLLSGANFSELAKQFSEDKLTYMNGGEMPEFSCGKYEPDFEEKIFDLKKDGDISRPILTDFGYHIVKRLHLEMPAGKGDEAYVFALKQQLLQNERMSGVKAHFLKAAKIKTGYIRNTAVKDADLFRYADSVTIANEVKNYPINKKIILSFAKSDVKGSAWLNFVRDYKLNTDVYKGENNKELLEKFIETTVYDYYRKHLEEYNADFKYQMGEFKEGNMLFEIMERNIWSKAANDSVGLTRYYNTHTADYKWAESADVVIFNCNDNKTAGEAVLALRNGKSWRQVADDSNGKVQADSGRYELVQLQLPASTIISEGVISAPHTNDADNTTTFVKLLKIFPANQPRNFEEAKGLVINDYQNYLEERWLEALKKEYPIKVNQAVFDSLLK